MATSFLTRRDNEKENKEINIRVIRFLANDNSCTNNVNSNFDSEYFTMVKATKQMKCCICEIEIDNGMDYHNPSPLGTNDSDEKVTRLYDDVCCTYCNVTKVIPARIDKVQNEKRK